MTGDRTSLPPFSGDHERRLATNYLTRQGSQLVGIATGLAVITVLARRLPLGELGVYALLVSLTTYAVVIQGIVETPAIKVLAEASDQPRRDRAFSTVLAVYSAVGVAASVLVGGLGALLIRV